MRVMIFAKEILMGKSPHVVPHFTKLLTENGFEITFDNPELILAIGGDGTFLLAENAHPGIPKLILRDSKVCNLCEADLDEYFIQKLKTKSYKVESIRKIEAQTLSKKLVATNEIAIRNENQRVAIRFDLNDHHYVGDGIVACTKIGLTGYFKSIVHKIPEAKFALAFNNTREKHDPIIFDEEQFHFKLKRSKAIVTADNAQGHIKLDEGESIIIKPSSEVANLVRLM